MDSMKWPFSFPWNKKRKVTIPMALDKPPVIPDFILVRVMSTDEGTFGLFTSKCRRFSSHMIELPWRNNTPNMSCIPTGVYDVVPFESPRFGRVWEVTNVEGRTYILIHPGNFAGDRDKGLWSDLRGCLAPGRARGPLMAKTGKKQQAVRLSRPALSDLMRFHGWEPFTLEIKEAF